MDNALRHLSDDQRARLLAAAETVSAPPGTLVITEGEPTPGVVLVLDGTVSIEKDYLGARVPLDELGAGELLGEVSYLLGTAATATVVAQDGVRLAIVSRDVVDQLVAEDPVLAANLFRSWAEVLAARLDRRTGDMVGMHWSWG
jgi:CRP-like cAMP-binding protein